MNDREKRRERVRDIRASGTIWWWWWWLTIQLNISHLLTQLNDQIVLFLTIQFSMFVWIHFKCQTVLFGPKIWPYQVPPLQVRVGQWAMTVKVYSTFPQNFSITWVSKWNWLMSFPEHSLEVGGSYPSGEMQSVYSTITVDWVVLNLYSKIVLLLLPLVVDLFLCTLLQLVGKIFFR